MLGLWRFLFEGPGADGPTPLPALARRITTPVTINNLPLQRTGLMLAELSGASLTNVTRPTPTSTRVPGLTSGRYAGLQASAPRSYELIGTLIDVEHATLQQQLALLNDWLGDLLEIVWAHAPHALQLGMAGPAQPVPVVPTTVYATARHSWRVTVPIVCADGAVYRRQPRRLWLGQTPTPVEVGGLPVGGLLLLQGPLSGTVTIDVLAPSGVIVDRLVLVIPGDEALAAGDVCTISLDAPHRIVKRTVAGVETPVTHWRDDTASTGWWRILPRFADRARGQWPMLRLSTGTGQYRYHLAEAA